MKTEVVIGLFLLLLLGIVIGYSARPLLTPNNCKINYDLIPEIVSKDYPFISDNMTIGDFRGLYVGYGEQPTYNQVVRATTEEAINLLVECD